MRFSISFIWSLVIIVGGYKYVAKLQIIMNQIKTNNLRDLL